MGANARLQLLLENSKLKKGHNYVKRNLRTIDKISSLSCQKVADSITSSKMGCWLVVLLFYVHGKHLRSCRDGQLT